MEQVHRGVTAVEVFEEYAASLIEPDKARRLKILEHLWSDDCEIALPEARIVGRAATTAHITSIRRAFGHATPVLVGPVDAHNGYLRSEWRMVGPAGEMLATGVNFRQQAADGRLHRVVLFRGVRPRQYV